MRNQIKLFLIIFLFGSGCAPVISEDLRAKAEPSLTFREVLQNPNAYKGKIVIWGGEIIQIVPQEDGTTFVEVLQMSLGWRGRPKDISASEGKFLVFSKEFSDLYLFKKEKKITVAGEIWGEIQGDKIKNLSDIAYRYPLLLSRQVHLWEDFHYPFSNPQYYYNPWEYNPSDRGLRF
jgi:outer membrane lipoprotein